VSSYKNMLFGAVAGLALIANHACAEQITTAGLPAQDLSKSVKILPPYPAVPPQPIVRHVAHNPIIADGSYYSADPAPVVVGDTLYILAGRDEAPADGGGFVMNEWQLLSTQDVASGVWKHYPGILRPEKIFGWAAPGSAYGGQIIQGRDKKFYLYAPVMEANCHNRDCFGVGVAVADNILGPWKDAHPAGPIASQSVPVRNDIQNIDPTPFIDEDGRVYLYWGTFGQLRAMELAADMITPKSPEQKIDGLTGFFEAAWMFKRNGIYYMSYAANNAGPDSECTPAVYHACIAYGTATSPMGPWTYRGVILKPVSSTTSHEGVIRFKDKWYLTYHTADAKGGDHFRRSVAIDEMQWDDTASPPAIKLVHPTPHPATTLPPQRNIAPAAKVFVSNEPVPVQYWTKALNDGIVRPAPLPPDMWGTWIGNQNPAQPWIAYLWTRAVSLNGSRIYFWNDHPAGSGDGVAPPKSWHLEYCSGKDWLPVKATSAYGTATNRWVAVSFEPVTTRCLRAVFDASSSGSATAAVAVQEWEALAVNPMEIVLPTQP
jgi:hypothetical protein